MVVTALPGTDVLSTLEEMGEDVLGEKMVLAPSAPGLFAGLGWPEGSILDLSGVDTALATEHVAPTVRALATAKFNIGFSR